MVLEKNAKPQSDEIMDFQSPTNDGMIAMLAEVKKPTHKGYWADALEIMPGDNIEDKIKEYPEKVQANIRKVLSEVLKNNIDPNDSFIKSFISEKVPAAAPAPKIALAPIAVLVAADIPGLLDPLPDLNK